MIKGLCVVQEKSSASGASDNQQKIAEKCAGIHVDLHLYIQ